MHLYHVTLRQPTALTHSIVGNFSGVKQQEILVVRGGQTLELLNVDPDTGKMTSMAVDDTFGIIRSICPVRLAGSPKDYIVVGSDSGCAVILEYHKTTSSFVQVHREPFGKTGCRRITPGQYVAADPKGRACLFAAVEKQKLVYVLNRDSADHLTISSPLEAHKSGMLTFDVVGLDVGFENPRFACIEQDYTNFDLPPEDSDPESQTRLLVFYDLDLGLNHVVRQWSSHVSETATTLIPLPGESDGPGGVIVCSEGRLEWMNINQQSVGVDLPMRTGDFKRPPIVESYCCHRMKTEYGDILKLTCKYENGAVTSMTLTFFDVVPVSSSINVLRSGFLFACAESGPTHLFQIESLGDDESTLVWSSDRMDDGEQPELSPQTALRNLTPVDHRDSSNPCLSTQVLNLSNEEAPQIYSLCGTGPNSSLQVIRKGIEVEELVSYPLPATPVAVWALKKRREDQYQSYIVIAFVNATLVLSIGESVEEVEDSGLHLDSTSILCAELGASSLVQVCRDRVRHISENGVVTEWTAPDSRQITLAECNGKQLVVALDSEEIVYFELDELQNLNEFQEHRNISDIRCLALGPVKEGRQKSKFLAVGCGDSTIRMVSVDANNLLGSLGMQALNSAPNSACFVDFMDYDRSRDMSTLYLNVGLINGVLIRTVIDENAGTMSDSRSKYLGVSPVRIHKVRVDKNDAFIALSTRSWLGFSFRSQVRLEPLTYDVLTYASSFVSEQCEEGIIGVSGDTLRIISLKNLSELFHTSSIPLKFTPRKFVYEPLKKLFVVIEGDHGVEHSEAVVLNANGDEEDEDEESEYRHATVSRLEDCSWASVVRVVDPIEGTTRQEIPLGKNEMATALCRVIFHQDVTTVYFVVAAGTDQNLKTKTISQSLLYLYRMSRDGTLEFVHQTELEGCVTALSAFQGRLLAGMDRTLRIYDLGKKKLLRKTETSVFPHKITGLATQGDRIYVSDVQESVAMARYIYKENVIIVLASDSIPSWISTFCVLDYNTICAADKFGSIFIKRLSKSAIEELEEDFSGTKLLYERGYTFGKGRKYESCCSFFVGDVVTSLVRSHLVGGGREVILYSTLLGRLGVLIPIPSREDVEFFTQLETHMRRENSSLGGREHLSFRSYYSPVKAVVDGDLVELYNSLPLEKKQTIAENLERSVSEVARQIEMIRTRVS